jgi:hypothetical protein
MTTQTPMWTRVNALRDRAIQLRQALDHLGLHDLLALVTDEDIALLADTSMVLQKFLDPDQQRKERAAIWQADRKRGPGGKRHDDG